MTAETLNEFIREIMSINATTNGMGGAAAGVIGTTSPGETLVNDLKHRVIKFASGYRDNSCRKANLHELSKQIEGLLLTLQVMSVMSEEHTEKLTVMLQKLLKS